MIIRPGYELYAPFAHYVTQSDAWRTQLDITAYGAAQQQLSQEVLISNQVLAVLSVKEQHAIADFLDRETAKIDVLIAKIKKAIKLLKEYRTALVSAAVTGKIDVREEVEAQEVTNP